MLSGSWQLKVIMLLTILGFLCGIVLSFRFDILILVPAVPFGWLLVVVGGIGSGAGAWILLGMILVAVALQFGYMVGIVAQWALRMNRAVPRSWPEKSAAASDRAF